MQNVENTPELELDENQNQEEVDTDETTETDPVDTEEQDKDWKAEALKLKAILDRNKNKTTDPSKSKSDSLDYGKKAFLTANGIKGQKEFDFVAKELKQSGQDLEGLLENDYFITRLEKFRALDKTSNAVPSGSRAGGQPTDTVEYWLSKPIEDVPQEMRAKVVNAKLDKEKSTGVFYNSKK